MRRLNRLNKSGEELHALFALVDRHLGADAAHYRKMKIAFQGPLENHSVRIDEIHLAAIAQKCDRRALGDFDFDSIGKRAPHRGLLHPRQRFDLLAALVKRNAQHAVIAIGCKNSQHIRRLHVVIARDVNLVGLQQRHCGSMQKKIFGNVSHACQRESGEDPQRHAQIRHPGFPAELPPLDLERLLPPEILRLFVRQNFLRVNVRVHGPQFRQKITSFSSSTP